MKEAITMTESIKRPKKMDVMKEYIKSRIYENAHKCVQIALDRNDYVLTEAQIVLRESIQIGLALKLVTEKEVEEIKVNARLKEYSRI